MGRPVVHFEIGAADIERAGKFYGELFGWSTASGSPEYGLVDTDAGGVGINGGLMKLREGMPAYVTVYVGVDDLEETLRHAEELGSKTIVEPMPIEGVGAFAVFADPDGNPIGLMSEERG